MDALGLTGKQIKSYQIDSLLGEGGYGVVYRASQTVVAREVAIKVILPRYANSPEFIRRFESEAQVIARLEHPHVVPLYDYWREPDSAYLVMRYLRGGSLRDRIDKTGALRPESVSKILEQVAAALTFAHRNGVIHRDIKADNILLDEDGNAYLGDFGIAKELGTEANLTKDNIIGTPAYIPPEQIRGLDAIPQSDVYAFGIMLYEILTGRRPFADLTPATLLYKHLNEPLPMIDHNKLQLPAAINTIIQRATAKEPDVRYPDAMALVRDFQQAIKLEEDEEELSTLQISAAELDLFEAKNPYKGLRAFQQADASDFFGRSVMIERILDRLDEKTNESDFLAVIGPSGSGKSSLVKAGVIPALRAGRIDGSKNWFFAEMVPGQDPIVELEVALLSVSTSPLPDMMDLLREGQYGLAEGAEWALPTPDSKLVLLIDQFEEIFTQVENEQEREHFLNLIYYAVMTEDSPVKVIITLRADFYHGPLLYADFGELIRTRTEIVLPLSASELEEAITGPAGRVGAVIEDGLVDQIVHDVREQPGALPLLQYALTELFERREGPMLTVAAYEEIGGTLGALARRAEEVFRRFNDASRQMTQQIFLRLVTLGEGQEDTRRRVLQNELMSLGDPRIVEDVLDRFGRYRLLTFDHDDITRTATVEVAHEALIRQWERLRDWLNESREDLRLERRLLHAADEWNHFNRDRSYLLQGTRLEQFREWAQSTSLQLNDVEETFLSASIDEHDAQIKAEKARQAREHALEQRNAKFLRALVAVMAVSTLIAVVLSVFAVNERDNATQQQEIAENERMIAESARSLAEENEQKNLSLALAANARNALLENEPALALPIAIEANSAHQPADAEIFRILARTAYAPGPRYRFTGKGRSIIATASNADGTLTVFGGMDGIIHVWDNNSGILVTEIDLDGVAITGVDFSPDSSLIAASLADNTVGVWVRASEEEYYRLTGHEGIVSDVEFSPDGQILASASADTTIRLWDMETGELINTLDDHPGFVFKIDFSPDGRYLVSSSGDGTLGETAEDNLDRTVRVWDVETGENITVIDPQSGFVRDIAFSPDSTMVASASWDSASGGTARVYDMRTGEEIRRFFAHRDVLTSVEFSPDGTQLVTASWDKSIKFWDLEKGVQTNGFVNFAERILDIEFTPDGEYMLIALGNVGDNAIISDTDAPADSAVWLWDLQNRTQSKAFTGHTDWAWTLDISPDGKLLASGSGPLRLPDTPSTTIDTSVRIWDIASGQEIRTLKGHTNTVDSVKFTLDGTSLLSSSWDGTIKRWDVVTGRLLHTYEGHTGEVFMLDLMPDGARFVSASGDGTLKMWNIESGEVLRTYTGHGDAVNGVNVSADGKTMLSASSDSTIRLWEVDSGSMLREYRGHTSSVNYARFTPDQQHFVSTSWDDTVREWEVATGDEIRQFVGHTGNTFGIAFSDDATIMLTTSSDTTVRMWEMATGEELNRFDNHTDWVQEVLFSPDQTFAISAGQDNTLRQWLIARTTNELVTWAQANRYIRDLTCAERETYRLSLCTGE